VLRPGLQSLRVKLRIIVRFPSGRHFMLLPLVRGHVAYFETEF
jgi:hypothetical protein